MENKIIELISQDKWNDAINLFIEVTNDNTFTDKLAVIGATISAHIGDEHATYDYLIKGLQINPYNYELYILLGNYHLNTNPNLCYLCYENAYYLCNKIDNQEDSSFIKLMMEQLKNNFAITVSPCSVLIKGYINEDVLSCINSFKSYCCSDSYEIIATLPLGEPTPSIEENNITILSYNGSEEDIYNFMLQHAYKDNDILILDETAMMLPNSLFTLRMELYSNNQIGAVGPMSNCAGIHQIVSEHFNNMDDCVRYAEKSNFPINNSLEYKIWLEPFAILIKRNAVPDSNLFDSNLLENQYMENDLGLTLLTNDKQTMLCHNCFIYRNTQKCIEKFNYLKVSKDIELENNEYFKTKWSKHNSPLYYGNVRYELIDFIKDSKDACINVLEVGCGTGATLSHIQYLFPNATVHGIEIVEEIAKLGAMNHDIISGDIESMKLPYEEFSFDYIIFGDVLEHLRYPKDTLIHMKRYLKKGGHIITSIPNLMNARVIYNLLHGHFTYTDEGILDRTHMRFFTCQEIIDMFHQTGYSIDSMIMNINEEHSTDNFKEFFDALLSISGIADKNEFDTFQYYVLATKENE